MERNLFPDDLNKNGIFAAARKSGKYHEESERISLPWLKTLNAFIRIRNISIHGTRNKSSYFHNEARKKCFEHVWSPQKVGRRKKSHKPSSSLFLTVETIVKLFCEKKEKGGRRRRIAGHRKPRECDEKKGSEMVFTYVRTRISILMRL